MPLGRDIQRDMMVMTMMIMNTHILPYAGPVRHVLPASRPGQLHRGQHQLPADPVPGPLHVDILRGAGTSTLGSHGRTVPDRGEGYSGAYSHCCVLDIVLLGYQVSLCA